MKTLFLTWFLTIWIYLQILTSAFGQSELPNHFDLNAGLSITDGSNVGVRYHFGQNNVGINFGGGLPGPGHWQLISSVAYYRHLWGHSKYTSVDPWYIKGAVHFNYSESELTRGNTSDTRNAAVRLFIGRDFNISQRIAFSSAIGPVYIFFEEFYGNQRIKPRLIPGLDLMIFYRLRKF